MPKQIHAATELAPIPPWDEGAPRLHAPAAFGAGPGSMFLLPLPATGERPLTFAAEGLPEGLRLDAASGIITGRVDEKGELTVLVSAGNAHGHDEQEIRLAIGGRLALTPPLGWNSWNCWGAEVTDANIRAAADAMVAGGLAAHGYSYINIDDGWQGSRDPQTHALQGNEKFPDMAGLCEHIHSLGLRAGIYSTPWVKSYARFPGGSEGECARDTHRRPGWHFGTQPRHVEDARQWAQWGFDYLKYDWAPWEADDVAAMADALKASGRDIVYSLSNSAPFDLAAEWARLANCWRTTGDLFGTWDSLCRIAFTQDRWTPYAGPGHWNDPDMLVVGPTRFGTLTLDEQITHMTVWALLAAPLMIGFDLAAIDDFTSRLLCNDEVLAVNQDPLGKQGRCLHELRRTDEQGQAQTHEHIFARKLHDGSLAVGLINRADEPREVQATWAELGLTGPRRVRDLWARRDLGRQDARLRMGVPAHGAQLLELHA